MRNIVLICGMVVGLATVALAAAEKQAAPVGQRYCDDFQRPSAAWCVGRAVLSDGRGVLRLSAWHPEATLAGTAVHPENLKTFRATLRWNFGSAEKAVLLIGWGKPFEWSRPEECPIHLAIGRDGRVTAFAGTQAIGAAQLASPQGGLHELTFAQQPKQLMLNAQQGKASFSLPAGQQAPAGYLTLQAQGVTRARGEKPLEIRHVEIEAPGGRPPLTPGQREQSIQAWARRQLARNTDVLEQFAAHVRAETKAGRWGFSTDLAVRPGMVRPGEIVEVTLRAAAAVASPGELRVEPDFLSAKPGAVETLPLTWQDDGHGAKAARVVLTPRRPGNWRIVWRSGRQELSRTLAVVDSGYTVCRFLITTHKGPWKPGHDPEAYDAIHRHGLAADYWDGAEWTSPFSRTPESLLAHFRFFLQGRHRFGDRVMPMCNANWMLPGSPDTNLWRLDEDVQRDGLRQVARLWDILGLGPMEILASYTFGHNTPRIARELGVKILDSLVQWQNWRDGADDNAWLINQWGAPTVPYYVADDDFRKVAPGKSILAFTQATTSSVRINYINTLEGQPQLSFLRRRSQDMAETSNIDRFQTTVDLWLAEAPHQAQPLFVSVGLENFVDSPDWNEANKQGVEYFVRQAQTKKVVFASAVDIADFFHRHYDRQPENWLCWPDVYCGYQAGYKPAQVADRIELSNAQFHCEHADGAALPRFFWDYTRPWSEPVWDDQAAIRQKHGLLNPELLTAANCVPRMVDLTGFQARAEIEPQPGGVQLCIQVEAPRAIAALPVALWRIPLATEGLSVAEASPHARFVRVVDGSTGNVHGVVVCNQVPKGRNTWTLRLRGQSRTPLEPTFRIGDNVRGRSFQRASGTTAYVWLEPSSKQTGTLVLRVPPGRQASVHTNDGHLEPSRDGVLRITLDHAWQHQSPMIAGLTAAEIQAGAAFQPAPAQP